MANPLEIQSQTKLIEERMRDLFLDLRNQYKNGEIKSRTEYLYQIFSRLRLFYETIGKPTFQPRFVDRLPNRDDYNAMLVELQKDLGLLYQEAQQIADALADSFLQMEVDRRSLDHQIRQLEDSLQSIEVKLKNNSGELIFRESFIDQSQFDQERPRDIVAHIWTREGVLTLAPRTAENYIEEASVRIVAGNGLPGNTKQVRSVNGELKFIGEENLHINLADILDSNADTWFEYEAFEFSPKVLSETGYLGFDYKERLSWRNEQGTPLTLTMEIELPQARPINWFSINPFIPNDKGAAASSIVSIEVHDGKGSIYRPTRDDALFGEEKVFLFGRQDCKRIVITFLQDQAYETEVGHLFYKEMEQQTTNYLGKVKYYAGKRVYGEMPSVENLNLLYDEEEKQLVYPTVKHGDIIENENKWKGNLFMLPKMDAKNTSIQVGHEKLAGRRYMVGIRDTGIANYQFETTSEYVSQAFTTVDEMLSVRLVTNEEVPKEFGEGEWVRYWITPDDGQNWYRIHPQGVTAEGAKLLYLFNTETPNEGRLAPFGYLDLTEPVRSLRLKIELARPTDTPHATYYTPIIKAYELHVTTRGADHT